MKARIVCDIITEEKEEVIGRKCQMVDDKGILYDLEAVSLVGSKK